MNIDQSVFKAYDIRGIAGEQLTVEFAYLLGRAYAQVIQPQPKTVGVGRDVRDHGKDLHAAVIRGLADEGVEIVDLGIISTDMLYFGVGYYELGGGISVTASHNPAEYNGFKMVKDGAQPISGETGIQEIKERMMTLLDEVEIPEDMTVYDVHKKDILVEEYIEYMKKFIDLEKLQLMPEMKIAFNANHGVAGEVITKLIQQYNLPITISGLYMKPDGSFPQGRPDPLYEANQEAFKYVITENECEFGCAWDADADRCFFFDHEGEFVDGYYVTAILAEMMLRKYPNTKIIHDPRLTWAVTEKVNELGGTPLVNKVGHSFIKSRMREEDAVFAGENSGHYYFRDYFYADNGIIPFLLILEKIVADKTSMKELAQQYRETYFISGEINSEVSDPDEVLEQMKEKYSDGDVKEIDGISVEYDLWRFNVRKSNTEPLVRLNVEAKSQELVDEKTQELLSLIRS